jgi:transcriptional regulator with XRE-family HTH domain
MGTSQSAVARIESGRSPSLNSLLRYAKAVGRKAGDQTEGGVIAADELNA